MKKIFYSLLLLLCLQNVHSQQVDNTTLKTVMTNWINQSELFQRENPGATISHIDAISNSDGTPSPMSLISLTPNGYIIATNNKKLPVVVSFSPTGSLTSDNLEEGPLAELIQENSHIFSQIIANDNISEEVTANINRWESLKNNQRNIRRKMKTTVNNPMVEPLLNVHWAQAKPYNRFMPACPEQSETDNHEQKTPTGCVATALAQYMQYYNWPTRGISSKHRITNETIKAEFYSDYSLPYDWKHIKPYYNESDRADTDQEKQAVGKLLLDAGISVNMSYNCSSSGAGFDLVTLNSQLLYNTRNTMNKTDFTEAKETLQKQQPILLAISGHAVVIDGFATEETTEYYHINYGWGNQSDGWYNLPGGELTIVDMYNTLPQPIAVFQPMKYTQPNSFQLKWDIPGYYEKGITGYSIDGFRIKQGAWSANTGTVSIPNGEWTTDGARWHISDAEAPYCQGIKGTQEASSIVSESLYTITSTSELSFVSKKEAELGTNLYTEIATIDEPLNWYTLDKEWLAGNMEQNRQVNIPLSKYAGKTIKIRFRIDEFVRYPDNKVTIADTKLTNVHPCNWTVIADNLAASTRSYQVTSGIVDNNYLYRIESKYNGKWYTSPIIETVKITPTDNQAPTLSFDNDIITYTFNNYTDCSIPLQITDAETPVDELKVSTFYCSRPDVFNATLSRFIPDGSGNGHGTLKLYPRSQSGSTLMGVMVTDAAGNTTQKLITVILKDGTPTEETTAAYYITPTGNGDYSGTSWENASSDLEMVLERASRSVATEKPVIYVASGTITGNFTMVEGVNVYGGYNPETGLQDLTRKTVLDGNGKRVLTQTEAFTTPTTWKGFEIINGGGNKMIQDADNGGGALLRDGGIIEQCAIHDVKDKGGICCIGNSIVKNTIVYNNSSSGIILQSGAGEIINCTIANNSSDNGVTINENGKITNSIVWGNNATIASTVTCNYSALPITVTGEGNIVLNTVNDAADGPNFANYENGDYSLLSSSACVNKGNNELASATDFFGNNRIRFQTVDMGAIELQELTAFAGTTTNLDNFSVSSILDVDLIIQDGSKLTYSTDITVKGTISYQRSFASSDKWYAMVCPYNAILYSGNEVAPPDQYEMKVQEAGGYLTWTPVTDITKGRAFLIKVSAGLAGQILSFVSETNEVLNNTPSLPVAPTDENSLLLCGNPSYETIVANNGVVLLPSQSDTELFKRMDGEQSISIFNAYLLGSESCKAATANVISGVIENRTFAYYVTPNGAGDKSGTSWENAMNDINTATGIANAYADPASDFKPDVRVSSGTFTGNFTMVEGINVCGSYNTTTNLPDYTNRTVLNGNGRRVLTQPQAFSTPTTWRGFEIINGGKGHNEFGGGVLLYNNGIIDKCYIHNIQDNNVHHGGGIALYQGGTLMNSVIANNSSSSNGGGIFVQNSGNVINCTAINNHGGTGGVRLLWGGTVTNSVIWKSDPSKDGGSFNYSASEQAMEGDTNILLNANNDATDGPNFTDWENGNYSLKFASPCINKGDNTVVTTEGDYLGNQRIRCQRVDMGAYESQKTYTYNEATGEVNLMEWIPTFLDDVVPAEVTSMDATTITIPTGATLPIGLNPNCLIYTNSTDNTNALRNVVLMNGNEGTAESIVLQDGYSFYNTKNITAGNVTYTRYFLDGWNTFALPFGTSVTDGDRIEEFSQAYNDYIKFTTATTIAANTAYLINIPQSGNKVFSVTNNVLVPPTETIGTTYKSNFRALTGETVAGKYILDLIDGKEVFARATTLAQLPAFRGYLDLPATGTKFKVVHNGGATDIDAIDAKLSVYSIKGNLIIRSDKAQTVRLYSIDGRLADILKLTEGENIFNTLSQGVYFINNQKVIIK